MAPDSPTILVSGVLTFEHYFQSHRHAARATRFRVRCCIFLLGGVLFLIGLLLISNTEFSVYFSGVTLLAVGTALVSNATWVSAYRFRRTLKQRWDSLPEDDRKVNFLITANGVTSYDDAGQPSLMHWSRFKKWEKLPALFLIYISPVLWLLLPDDAIDDVELLRSFLETYVQAEEV